MDTTKASTSPWANGEELEELRKAEASGKPEPRFEPGSAQAIALDMVKELEGCAKSLRAVLDTATEMKAEEGPKNSPATDERVVMLLAGLLANGHNDAMNHLAGRMIERLESLDPEAIRKARESMVRPRSPFVNPFDGL